MNKGIIGLREPTDGRGTLRNNTFPLADSGADLNNNSEQKAQSCTTSDSAWILYCAPHNKARYCSSPGYKHDSGLR
uniref:Uncharacterized protein n=1 Tax=Sparus aurata TaxID=8175 RepID=A0A671WRB9_SPAAU